MQNFVLLVPALTDFSRVWIFLLFSYLLLNFVSETVVMKIYSKNCLVIIYKHIAHFFFMLGAKQWGIANIVKGLPIFGICQQSLHQNLNVTQKWIVNLWKVTNNKDLPHQILRKSERETLYLFYLA